MKDQSHPLYSIDRDHVNRLLARDSPQDNDFVDLARLLTRYDDFPGAMDLKEDMNKVMKAWGVDRQTINLKARELWEGGFRPLSKQEKDVGSGFDTADDLNV